MYFEAEQRSLSPFFDSQLPSVQNNPYVEYICTKRERISNKCIQTKHHQSHNTQSTGANHCLLLPIFTGKGKDKERLSCTRSTRLWAEIPQADLVRIPTFTALPETPRPRLQASGRASAHPIPSHPHHKTLQDKKLFLKLLRPPNYINKGYQEKRPPVSINTFMHLGFTEMK